MLSHEDNDRVTRVGWGTPMGEVMRRYWLPACLSTDIAQRDGPPIRTRLLGEDLVAFRDTNGRVGVLSEYCRHRRVSLFLGRNEECGLRCVYHGWKYDVEGRCVDLPSEPINTGMKDKVRQPAYPAV
ncbi:MAG: Rieske 2Fe-2S domain-containing protein, partial [Chloroflexi bacterium]|nr:Rieske 2Fe-2S domain-containing protein [Chloroflexota bacterium]